MVLALSYLTDYFLVRSFLGYKYRFFVAPGIIIHELSHALACLICWAKIREISFFDQDGGYVKHEKSPIPIFGPILISTAPLVISIIIFYFLGRLLKLEGSLDFGTIIFNLKLILKSINFVNWRSFLAIYLLLSVAVTMTPSRQDLINMLTPLVILVAVFYLLFRFTKINQYYFNFIFIKLIPILNLAVFVLLICLLISFLLYILTELSVRRG
jgi:hypothetical protein